jgi:DnaJ-class molecular chaperone
MRNNRADGKRSSHYSSVTGRKCTTCGGSGSAVDSQGRHKDACPTCRGFGKTEN